MIREITIDDLLTAAPDWFKDAANKIETTTNLEDRAKLAKETIKDNNLVIDINMDCLGLMLKNAKSFPLSWWRNVYLIERSSVPRNANISWFRRVIIFYDTYVHENNIVTNAIAPNGKKFYFIKGNAEHPTYHNILHAGRGENKADFYFYDDSIEGSVIDKMVKVEHKYCTQATIEEAAAYYKDNHSYNARYLTLYKEPEGYYIYDYQTTTYTKLEKLQKPKELIEL